MAKDKNSFTAYCDWGNVFDELSDEEAGKLIKHLFDYVRDKNPVAEDSTTKLLFIQMKATLKRDLKKWEAVRDKNRENGSKGGRPEKPKKPSGLNGNPKNPSEPKKPVRVRGSVRDNVSESDSLIINLGDVNEKHFILISSKYIGESKYRLYGVGGVAEYIEEVNFSKWKRSSDMAEKFMRDKDGQLFNDYDHILKSYNKYVEKQFA